MNIDVKKLQAVCLAKTQELIEDDSYIFYDNKSTVLAVAHCDTVFDEDITWTRKVREVTFRKFGHTITCGSLDDRLGVFTALFQLPKMGINVDVLLTTNEECGQSTASTFISTKKYNWVVELDREGSNVVQYQYDSNEDFNSELEDLFDIRVGSYSDISSMKLECCAFNLGLGTSNSHSHYMSVNLYDYCHMLKKLKVFYERNKDFLFVHKEQKTEKHNKFSKSFDKTLYDKDLFDKDLFDSYDFCMDTYNKKDLLK